MKRSVTLIVMCSLLLGGRYYQMHWYRAHLRTYVANISSSYDPSSLLHQKDRIYLHILHNTLGNHLTMPILEKAFDQSHGDIRDAYSFLVILNSFLHKTEAYPLRHFHLISSALSPSLLALCKGLISFSRKDFGAALLYFNQVTARQLQTNNPYLSWVETYFSPQWLSYHKALCMFHLDDFDGVTHMMHPKDWDHEELAPQANALYITALLHQTNSMILSHCKGLFDSVCDHLTSSNLPSVLPLLQPYTIRLWQHHLFEKVVCRFLDTILLNTSQNERDLFMHALFTMPWETLQSWIDPLIAHSCESIPYLRSYAEKMLIQAIDTHNFSAYAMYSAFFFGLCNTPETIEHAENLLHTHLVQQIMSDPCSLEQTRAWITNWLTYSTDRNRKEMIAHTLFVHGSRYWHQSGGEAKGLALLRLGTTVTMDRSQYLAKVEAFLNRLFTCCERANTLERLALIYDACTELNIPLKIHSSEVKIAHLMADAVYHFTHSNFREAQQGSAWVLKLSPQHQEALKLHGLSCYYLGDYPASYLSLSELGPQDPITQQILTHVKNILYPQKSGEIPPLSTSLFPLLEEEHPYLSCMKIN